MFIQVAANRITQYGGSSILLIWICQDPGAFLGIVVWCDPLLADNYRFEQETRERREQPEGPNHIPEEHEGKQNAHVSLELNR